MCESVYSAITSHILRPTPTFFFFTARVAVAVHACACMSATVFSQHDVAECAVNNKKHEEAGEGGGRRRKRRRRIGTHSIPEHDVHTKLPTVMSV